MFWENDNIKLTSYDIRYFDKDSGNYIEKTINPTFYKRVQLANSNKTAIIISILEPSFSSLKYIISCLQLGQTQETINELIKSNPPFLTLKILKK